MKATPARLLGVAARGLDLAWRAAEPSDRLALLLGMVAATVDARWREGSPSPAAVAERARLLGATRTPPAAVLDAMCAIGASAGMRTWLQKTVTVGERGLDFAGSVYEMALHASSHGTRRRHGVYHTPPALVGALVRASRQALVERLGVSAGLSGDDVLVVEPAAGTGAFLEGVLDEVGEREAPPRMLAVERCAVAAALLRARLETRGGGRLEVIEGDALSIAGELHGRVTAAAPQALVVLGNPPYRGHSPPLAPGASPIAALLEEYRQLGGEPLGERNAKWLQDDYVKFVRLAHWLALGAEQAVVAFVTNHAWLDNPTFRGMRESVLADFDDVIALDLGGNRRRRGRDENLFDIVQGVAAVLLVRGVGGRAPMRRAGTLLGGRVAKTALLSARPLVELADDDISPRAPAYELRLRDAGLADEFSRGVSLAEIFPLHGPGVVTSRDEMVTASEEGVLRERIAWLLDESLPDDDLRRRLGGVSDTRVWKLGEARVALRRSREAIEITPYLYRPFERRFACLHPALVERARQRVMRHMLGDGALALVAMRQVALDDAPYSHVLVADCPVDNRVMYSNRGIVSVFPLWLVQADARPRLSGLDESYVAQLARIRGRSIEPLEAFDLVLGTLMSRGYRERFAECLALELPRVPWPGDTAELEDRIVQGRSARELLLGSRAPPPAAVPGSLAWLGGYSPERLLERATDPDHARAVLGALP